MPNYENPENYLDRLDGQIEKRAADRLEVVAALARMLTKEGVRADSRKGREVMASTLEQQGMTVAMLDMIIAHLHSDHPRAACKPALLCSWLTEQKKWEAMVEDLYEHKTSQDERMKHAMDRYHGRSQKDHVCEMPRDQRIFYAFFYDMRPKEEIARMANVSEERVLDIFREQATIAEVPEREIERRLKRARRDPEEEHSQFNKVPNLEEPVGNMKATLSGLIDHMTPLYGELPKESDK